MVENGAKLPKMEMALSLITPSAIQLVNITCRPNKYQHVLAHPFVRLIEVVLLAIADLATLAHKRHVALVPRNLRILLPMTGRLRSPLQPRSRFVITSFQE